MRQEVALLVRRAALDWDIVPQAGERRLEPLAAVDDHQLGLGHGSTAGKEAPAVPARISADLGYLRSWNFRSPSLHRARVAYIRREFRVRGNLAVT
jgi:hypothetical protein